MGRSKHCSQNWMNLIICTKAEVHFFSDPLKTDNRLLKSSRISRWKKWLRTYGDLILFLRTILTLRKRQYNVTLLTNTAHFSHCRLELSQILNVSSVKNEPSLLFVLADLHFDIKEMWNTLRWTICHFSTIHTPSWCNLQQEKNKFLVLFQNQLLNFENNLVVKLQLSCDHF